MLAPKSHDSLIGQVRIAIDSRHRVPLRVQVFARGAASPAGQVGFTAVSFGPPPAADYAFTPPAGATVTQQHIGAARPGRRRQAEPALASGVRVIGTGWLAVASLPESSLAGAALPGGPGGAGLIPFRYSSALGRARIGGPGRRPAGGQPGGGPARCSARC